jgi:UDP-glucuronate 4-epimerase
MSVVVTGGLGFIGAHVAAALMDSGEEVVIVDSLTDYYSVDLKLERKKHLLGKAPKENFFEFDLVDRISVSKLLDEVKPRTVIHLAAQAGVRLPLELTHKYVESNLTGFSNVLQSVIENRIPEFLYASSSSVYGDSTNVPYSENAVGLSPISFYGATKLSNELLAKALTANSQTRSRGMRFFTVYGPWGRPDMAPMLFANAIVKGEPIKVFNEGKMRRDFTFVEDVAEGVVRTLLLPATPDPDWNSQAPNSATSNAPYRIYNIGNHEPVELLYFIELMEKELGIEAKKTMLPMQPGDVLATYADVDDLGAATGYRPSTSIENGVKEFVRWFKSYYDIR